MAAAVVLDEVVDADYEPSQQEINEYAEWLGMDLMQDEELRWIASEGLKAPLPPAWKPCQSSDGDIFYFNFETGESVWDHPCDEHYRRVYRRARAPVRVITISGSKDTDTNMLYVVCVGSLNGEELTSMTVKPTLKARDFRKLLAKQLDSSKRSLRLLLPCGRLLTESEDDKTAMAVLLDIPFESCGEEEVLSKEEQRQKRKELKEQRALEYIDRCQHLGGLAIAPEQTTTTEQTQKADSENEKATHDGWGIPMCSHSLVQGVSNNTSMLQPINRCSEPIEELAPQQRLDALALRNGATQAAEESNSASCDTGLLKSVLCGHGCTIAGFADVVRQRPQSLRLRPIPSSSRSAHVADDDPQIGDLENSPSGGDSAGSSAPLSPMRLTA
jgi:hypothetical protein